MRLTFGQGLFAIMLAAGMLNSFERVRDYVGPAWPIVQRWSDPVAQYRVQLGDVSYDALRGLDEMLPPEASILLVTDGQDVRHFEYSLFHRALYFLTPRSVWWLSPAPSDGTWESNWWIAATLTENSIRRVAEEKQVTHVLLVGASQQIELGEQVAQWGSASLVTLMPNIASLGEKARHAEFAGVVWPVQIAAAIGVIVALGYSIVVLLGYRAAWYETLALAWMLGAGMVSLGMTYLSWLGVGLSTQIIILSLVALVGMVTARWRMRGASANQRVSGTTKAVTAKNLWPVLVLALNVAFVVVLAIGRPLSIWDSWVTWGMKARTIFIEGGLSPAMYLDASRAVTHLDYPLMIPQLEAWTYGWLGAADDRFAGWQSIAFYLALLGICYAALRRWHASVSFALWVTAAIAMLGPLALWSGLVFAEVQVAMLVLAALLYLIDWLEDGSRQSLWIAALAAGLLPWAKREGWVLLFVLCICLVLMSRDRRAWKVIGAMLLAALLIAAPWWLFITLNGARNTDFVPINITTFAEHLDRVPVILRIMLSDLLSPGWNLLWVFAALFGVRLVWQRIRHRMRWSHMDVLPLVAAMYLALMGLSFVYSAYVPYQQHVATSSLRLMVHVAPLALMWIAARDLSVS